MTSVTFTSRPQFVRGNAITLTSSSGVRNVRVTRASQHTLTTRPLSRWPFVERMHCAWEEYVAWPLRDAWEWVRARVKHG